VLREFSTAQECADAAGFWKEEAVHTLKARDVVKKFEKVQPHDLFKIEPQSYNLSIQHEAERKENEAKAK